MAQFVYNKAKMIAATTGFSGVTFGLLLLDAAGGHTPNKDHDFVDDVVAAELSTTNYARQTLTGVSTTLNSVADRVEITADNVLIVDLGPVLSGPTVQAAVIYADVGGTDATRWLLAYLDGVTFTCNGEDVLIAFDSTGMVRFT